MKRRKKNTTVRTCKRPRSRKRPPPKKPRCVDPREVQGAQTAAAPASNPRRKRKKNARPDVANRERALYRKLHWGDPPTERETFDVGAPHAPLAVLGELVEVHYIASKNGQTFRWVHKFGTKSEGKKALPVLLVNAEQKLIVGTRLGRASYKVTAAGIEG
jgi:hypothetical protein